MFQILVDRKFRGWERGMLLLGATLEAYSGPWQAATDDLFNNTVGYVHVITGELRDSAVEGVETARAGLTGFVGFTAPYAAYEFGRGGSHDAPARGWEVTQDEFQAAMGRTWFEVTAAWGAL